MSLAIQYERLEDAQMRLANTIVLYDGEPVYIDSVGHKAEGDPKDDTFRVYATPLPTAGARRPQAEMRKFISSKKFDMAPFPMGFMNLDGMAFYCSRLPRRQQRQGLSAGTFSCIPVGAPQFGALRLENVVGKQEFVDCIKGKYPAYVEAVRSIEQGAAGSVAFDRSFALVQDVDMPELVYLYHKKEKVGFIMGDTLKLSKSGKCLTESLREAGVRL